MMGIPNHRPPGPIKDPPVIANGSVYFGTDKGDLHAIDAVTSEGRT